MYMDTTTSSPYFCTLGSARISSRQLSHVSPKVMRRVKGYRAGIRYRTAARGGVEDLGYGNGAAAQEACLLPVRIVFRVEHLYKALDLCFVRVIIFVEGAYVLKNVRHLIDRVVAALRCGSWQETPFTSTRISMRPRCPR